MTKAGKRPPINLLLVLSLLTIISCKDAADVEKDSAKFLMDNSLPLFSSGFPNTYRYTHKRRYRFYNHCSEKDIELTGETVTALGGPHNPNSNLILQSANFKRYHGFNIIGEQSGRFLCFNKKSKIILRFSGASPRCLFVELFSPDYYTIIKNVAHDWYIGFNKKGKALPGSEKIKSHRKRCFNFTKRGDHSYLDGLHETRHGPKISNPYKLMHLLSEQKIRRKRHNFSR